MLASGREELFETQVHDKALVKDGVSSDVRAQPRIKPERLVLRGRSRGKGSAVQTRLAFSEDRVAGVQ